MTPFDPTDQDYPPRQVQPPPAIPVALGQPPVDTSNLSPEDQPIRLTFTGGAGGRAKPTQSTPQPSQMPVAKGAPGQQSSIIPMPEVEHPGETMAARNLRDLQQSGSRISQVKNPVGHALLSIGDALLGTFAPRAERLIPGTEGNYGMRLGRAERAADLEQKRELEAAQEARARTAGAGEEEERAARTANLQRQTELLGQPKPPTNLMEWYHQTYPEKQPEDFAKFEQSVKPEKGTQTKLVDKNGNVFLLDQEGRVSPVTLPTGEQFQEKGPTEKAGDEPLGPFADQMNAANEQRYQVLHPGQKLPDNYRLTAQSTQKQADEIRNLLAGTESAEGVKTAREQARATAAAGKEQKSTQELRQAGMKAYTPALDSAERFNVMAKNFEDAVRNHDQQAMLSLLANHLGMTMGLQKGSRLTRDIIREAQQSRPWLQGMEAKFDKNGYLTGVTLTPMQMRQMVDLGRERFSEDVAKGRAEARYMGVNDEGPDRTPSKSTINHYTALANGDAAKAKQLAAADGWTVR